VATHNRASGTHIERLLLPRFRLPGAAVFPVVAFAVNLQSKIRNPQSGATEVSGMLSWGFQPRETGRLGVATRRKPVETKGPASLVVSFVSPGGAIELKRPAGA
jgi:hypothetical protein